MQSCTWIEALGLSFLLRFRRSVQELESRAIEILIYFNDATSLEKSMDPWISSGSHWQAQTKLIAGNPSRPFHCWPSWLGIWKAAIFKFKIRCCCWSQTLESKNYEWHLTKELLLHLFKVYGWLQDSHWMILGVHIGSPKALRKSQTARLTGQMGFFERSPQERLLPTSMCIPHQIHLSVIHPCPKILTVPVEDTHVTYIYNIYNVYIYMHTSNLIIYYVIHTYTYVYIIIYIEILLDRYNMIYIYIYIKIIKSYIYIYISNKKNNNKIIVIITY